MYNSIAVANYFVKKGIESRNLVTPMQINKLVFISHGWSLAYTTSPLIPEVPQAWKFGPVIESIYHYFKHHGGNAIDAIKFPSGHEESQFIALDNDENAKRLLDAVWAGYGKKSGIDLSAITHREGSPWDLVWNKEGGKNRRAASIPDTLIRAYYQQMSKAHVSRTTEAAS